MKNTSEQIIVLKKNDKTGFKSINIKYSFCNSPFGEVLIAKTEAGICRISLVSDNKPESFQRLLDNFPKASFELCEDMDVAFLDSVINNSSESKEKINFHLNGTPFQINVWNALLKIPYGKTVTYGDIAREIGMPNAQRAVGTAIGNNPVFFLIPCHRVIRKSGDIGNYYYGTEVKKKILNFEKSHKDY